MLALPLDNNRIELNTFQRPVIFEYNKIANYISDMLTWHKSCDKRFSIRKETEKISNCSPSLVSLVIKKNRKMTRDRVPAFASLLKLNSTEREYLDSWVARERGPSTTKIASNLITVSKLGRRKPSNHLLNDWLNVYVKDASRIKGFAADPHVIQRIIGNMGPIKRITKSLEFLVKEGFIRLNLDGNLISEGVVSSTTDNIPNQKIKLFFLIHHF